MDYAPCRVHEHTANFMLDLVYRGCGSAKLTGEERTPGTPQWCVDQLNERKGLSRVLIRLDDQSYQIRTWLGSLHWSS